MAVKAILAAINRYLGPAVSELGGARRDTMVLQVLFTHTIKGLVARCLIDKVMGKHSCPSYVLDKDDSLWEPLRCSIEGKFQ